MESRTAARRKEQDQPAAGKLPSRAEHRKKKTKKKKAKVKFPLLRLLSLAFILLPIGIYSAYQYFDAELPADTGPSGFETVELYEDERADGQEKAEVQPEENSLQKNTSKIDHQEPGTKTGRNSNNEPQVPPGNTAGSGESSVQSNPDMYKIIEHVVKPKETVFSIAMAYYQSQEGIKIIKKWNGLKTNEIQTGQILKIPMKKQ
ncbi:LysM peptidoglycan-binding domain-containing protein [Peribacillus sp. SCS-37]|uniref:LysM peptidoglycan-binding domain-containing protein n=1 Tax=Paraperibacillus esterisolvens TaxID=3115296 RepID=UPI003906A380